MIRNFLLIPDSFKGTMSSQKICDIMEKAILSKIPQACIQKVQVADGGEGSVDAFLQAVGGTKKELTVKGPLFEDVRAFYGVIDAGKTAVIEMAACAGLPLVGDRRDPLKTTTYGVGQLVLDAIQSRCTKIIMCLGGSATNDGGTGAAAALGAQFLDKEGNAFIPVGGTLKNIAHIHSEALQKAIAGVEIITMCDISNPLFGEEGAAYVFGPQKGADAQTVKLLDSGLRHLAQVISNDLQKDISKLSGAGAAGGMGGGMVAFFNSTLQMGIETVLDAVGFEALAKKADFILTGEGKIDSQSVKGKVVAGVARRAKPFHVPVVAIVGDIGEDIDALYDDGLTAVFSINRIATSFEQARLRAENDLALTVANLMGLLRRF